MSGGSSPTEVDWEKYEGSSTCLRNQYLQPHRRMQMPTCCIVSLARLDDVGELVLVLANWYCRLDKKKFIVVGAGLFSVSKSMPTQFICRAL